MTNILIAGVDEVGIGPLAGAVIAAAVILDPKKKIAGLKDSKQLSEKKRQVLAEIIKQQALCYAFGRAEHHEIDELNILQASLLAMQRAVDALLIKPQHVLVDGIHAPQLIYPVTAIIRGDQTEPAISAASIIAKVLRDAEMTAYHDLYPQYGFDQHKGYPTKKHYQAIKEHGLCPIHRQSFKLSK